MPKLYLLPTFISPEGMDQIPPVVPEIISGLRIFIVERTRTSRRFIKKLHSDFPIDECTFVELDKHNPSSSFTEIKKVLSMEKDIGFLSEAGVPCIADPGAKVVNMARGFNFQIKPISGPSSILLALMASGMNGQNFSFHGYLPIKEVALSKKLKYLSDQALKHGVTQVFMETPYRNKKMIQAIRRHIAHDLFLSVSMDLTADAESIQTKKVGQWKADDVGKSPAIFCLGALEKK